MPKRPDDALRDPDDVVARAIPVSVRIAGAWSWRIVGVVILAGVLVYLVALLHIVVVPVLVATLLSGLLTPFKNRLTRLGWPRWLAVVVPFLGTIVVIAGLVVLVVLTLRTGIGGIEQRTVAGYQSLLSTLKASPLGITDADVRNAMASVTATVQKNSGTILAGALSGASIVSDILVGLVLSLFLTLFFLIDGEGIWRWCVRVAPRRARAAVDGAGRAAWLSVGEYARVQILVALIDAVGIGLVALLLGVGWSLVVPIAVLVFLAAFIPFVGAVVTGGLAVLVVLLYVGPVQALIMLAGVIGVNQLESHILQPLLMGNAVRLHPVAVVLSVATGSLLGGIAGAVFAVPFVAAVNSAVQFIAGGAWKDDTPPPALEEPPTRARRSRRTKPEPQDVTTVG